MEPAEIYGNLVKRVKQYHPSKDLTLIDKAYLVMKQAHGDQKRKSGEPYIIHPLWVAYILADLELDLESIASGLLHDVIEDTKYEYTDIKNMFGGEVADIVDGVTKLDRIEDTFTADEKNIKNYSEELQAENYRKMFLAMAKDIRVILIKIADRLHNMRTLEFVSPAKQKEKAQETLDLYAPLAHRLGISKIRYEMEDLSFRYINPDAYSELSDKIMLKQSERQEYIKKIIDALKTRLQQENVEGMVEGRPKHFFSIYKKMVGQNKPFDQIFDLFAVRAIVNTIRDCYEVLGVAHELYTPMPGRFKDYIAMPKNNMYQSLHTTVMGPEGEPVEIQIRTWEMHRTAEYGIAAHWRYKEGVGSDGKIGNEEAKLNWLRQILDWQRDLSDNKEFLDALKVDLDVFKDHVYCFTPKGEIISLLRGATPIDFAYAIHSAVGNRMVGARVNGSIAPIDQALYSGDRVEIITSQNIGGPKRDWLSMVKTTQARNKINQWFKKENKDDNIIKGKELMEREAKKKGLTLSEVLTTDRKNALLNKFVFHDWDSLCAAVGHGGIKEGSVINKLNELYLKETEKDRPPEIILKPDNPETLARERKKKSGIVVKGVGDINVRFSKCCSPVPGDEIVGFVTRGRGVSLHRTDCVNVINLDELERQRLIESEWQLPERGSEGISYRAEIKIIADERMGLLVDISRVLTEERLAVKSLNGKTTDFESIFNITIEISSREQLERLKAKLLKLPGVHEIERVTV